eukprot:CAMPEP_0198124370 /NCGR_PEP_ID=MMETSP1442-20131203/39753_1 /TAXON_ID= /ORGANISM="Craspedostauros australis, Strain CCMP3328" /LENGTH=133 /DNA_ID=CAMNT_0043783753 /DNA_START=484 /DNA_END=882 /DNA_ORIENTATION=-
MIPRYGCNEAAEHIGLPTAQGNLDSLAEPIDGQRRSRMRLLPLINLSTSDGGLFALLAVGLDTRLSPTPNLHHMRAWRRRSATKNAAMNQCSERPPMALHPKAWDWIDKLVFVCFCGTAVQALPFSGGPGVSW